MSLENQPAYERILTPRARELLGAPDDVRLEHIKKPVFINYERSRSILGQLEAMLLHPITNRPPNVLIVSPSKNGKTEILKRFMADHPAQEQRDGDVIFAPVVFAEAPPGPDERLFLSTVLKVLGVDPKPNADTAVLIPLLVDSLRKAGVKVLLLDELHSILAGSATKQRLMLTLLKYVSNQTGISIAAAGTRDAKIALSTDAQLESRFPSVALPLWNDVYKSVNGSKKLGEVNELDRLLASFEAALPLRIPSNLHDPLLKSKICGSADGLLGGIAKTIQDTAAIAIESGTEAITEKILNEYVAAKALEKREVDAL